MPDKPSYNTHRQYDDIIDTCQEYFRPACLKELFCSSTDRNTRLNTAYPFHHPAYTFAAYYLNIHFYLNKHMDYYNSRAELNDKHKLHQHKLDNYKCESRRCMHRSEWAAMHYNKPLAGIDRLAEPAHSWNKEDIMNAKYFMLLVLLSGVVGMSNAAGIVIGNPTLNIWTLSQSTSPSTYWFGSMLDTFDNHIQFTTNMQATILVLTNVQYVKLASGQPYSVIEQFNGTNFNFWFNASEGCASYVYIIYAPYHQQAEYLTITPDITAVYNPSGIVSQACKLAVSAE